MSVWRAGTKTGRTLWRDEQLVGMVDSPEVAAEIVEMMNRVGALLDEVRRHNEVDGFQEFLRATRQGTLPRLLDGEPMPGPARHAVRCGRCDSWACCEHCGCS
jgi:hypothetical protein